jgi:K+-sensing histidine kinase KdpD
MIKKSLLDISQFNKKLRIKTYCLVVGAFISVFLISAFFNFRLGYTSTAIIQIILLITYSISILFALKGRYLELLSSIILYSSTIVLLSNITQFNKNDLGPYVGLIAILIVGYFLLRSKYSLLIYAAFTYLTFLCLIALDKVNLVLAISIKYQAVYLAIAIVTILNKHFDSIRDKNYDQSHKDLLDINKQFEAKILSEREAREESDKLNKVMVDRELKMIELKEKLKK